jgi:cytochrome c oxidase cbb3-type subunit 1
VVNNLAVPISLGSAKSYSVWSVQDAMVQWWYGHNAVAFLTAGFLGMMYYYLPGAGADLFVPHVDRRFQASPSLHVGGRTTCTTALPQWVQTPE